MKAILCSMEWCSSTTCSRGDTYDYVVPKEGSNVWFDNMVIPKTAQNKEGAYQFINFY